MDFTNLEKSTLGAVLTGIVALPFVAYKVWQMVKQDTKGDNVDARIQQFTSSLQTQLDKAIERSDKLQVAYNAVVSELASAKVRAEFLATENERLRQDLQFLRDKAQKGVI